MCPFVDMLECASLGQLGVAARTFGKRTTGPLDEH
jgi:hypothetical protein